jgi:hypothetical protein
MKTKKITFHSTDPGLNPLPPLGVEGDYLWMKETTFVEPGQDAEFVYYWSDWQTRTDFGGQPIKWTPSLFMKKKHARTLLKINRVWPERLIDISPRDCVREGAAMPTEEEALDSSIDKMLVDRYREIWNGINRKPKAIYGRSSDNVREIREFVSYPWTIEDAVKECDDVRFDVPAHTGMNYHYLGKRRGKPSFAVPNPWVWVYDFSVVEMKGEIARFKFIETQE